MLFSTWQFGCFFILFFIAYFGARRSLQLPIIIIGSTFFYAWWKPSYVWIPYALAGIAYSGALWISSEDNRGRTEKTIIGLALLFMPLLTFKYFDFLWASFERSIGMEPQKVLDLALPLGISFVTFTLSAYVIDVRAGRFPAERSFPRLLSYVLFFPHLIAGPILRPSEFLPQIHKSIRNPIEINFALTIIALGLFKKLVVADGIAPFVDRAYNATDAIGAWAYLVAIYGFSVQIYCDFSGYSDMAIGLALLLGITFPENFRAPYGAYSVIDFWRRWHITLSSWLRDYLYIPLGGNQAHQSANIIITMLLGGLWHGANWTFVAWGALHGIALATVHWLRNRTSCAPLLAWFLTHLLHFERGDVR